MHVSNESSLVFCVRNSSERNLLFEYLSQMLKRFFKAHAVAAVVSSREGLCYTKFASMMHAFYNLLLSLI